MIRAHDNQSDLDSSPRLSATTWCIAALLAAALVGLIHDRNYATALGADLVEDGRGVEDKSVMEGALDASQTGRAIGLVLLLAVGGVCVLTLPTEARIRWDGLSMLIVLALVWSAASILWSPERGTTARELARLYLYVGIAAVLARRFDPRTLCCVLAIALSGSVLTAVAFEIATGGFRPWHSDYRLTGSMHSNVLGVQSAVVALIAYAFAIRRAPRATLWWTVFLVATVIVYLTKARTAMISVIVGAVAVHIVGRPVRNWLFLASAAATLLAIVLLVASMFGALNGREGELANMGRTDNVSDLTGRLPLWNYINEQLPGYRLQGFGWGAFWLVERTIAAHDELGWYPRHSHDAYLQIVVNLGIVGLALALAIAIWAFARSARLVALTGRPEFSALAALFVGMFVNGIAESAFVMPRDMGLFSAAVVFSVVVVHQRSAALVPSRLVIHRAYSKGGSLWQRRSLGPGNPNPN